MDGTTAAMVLILGSNGHELLVRVLFLGRIIRLMFLEVWSKSYLMVSDVEHSYDKLCLPSQPQPLLPKDSLRFDEFKDITEQCLNSTYQAA